MYCQVSSSSGADAGLAQLPSDSRGIASVRPPARKAPGSNPVGRTAACDLEELSRKLRVSTRTLRGYVRDGKLQAFKLGLRYYVTQRAVDEYFDTPAER